MTLKFRLLLIFVVVFILTSITRVQLSRAKITQDLADIDLAEKYLPVLYFHPDEIFRPQPIDAFLSFTRLRKNRSLWFDQTVLDSVSIEDLSNYRDSSLFLDLWYGSAGESDYLNYSAHRRFYLENISPEVGGPTPTIYSIVVHDDQYKKTIVQYWLFYYYNDWLNKHEGDWELIQIILDNRDNPEWVVLSQHHGGTRRPWEQVRKEDYTHPAIFVALGSHANYFWGNETYSIGTSIGNARFEIPDRTGSSGRLVPEVVLISSIDQLPTKLESPPESAWLNFLGRWGEAAIQTELKGPIGPAGKGTLWETPYEWGILQPFDTDTWYQNRFQIRVNSQSPSTFVIENFENINRSAIDIGETFLLYHDDLAPSAPMKIAIESNDDDFDNLTISWPNLFEETVYDYDFNLNGLDINKILIDLQSPGNLIISSNGRVLIPTEIVKRDTILNNSDLIWFAGYLPASQVIFGILLSISAGVIPGLVYIFLVYQVDYFEREPTSLLLATFFWGALPAILVALIVTLFFSLPPGLLGPEAFVAIRTGIFSPLIEEAIKGVILVFISIRFYKEFDDILDGIIYGAFIGLGFAITGNTISYLGTFLTGGFNNLGMAVLIKGVIFGLNHATYSAIFGAGLGYTKITNNKAKKWVVSIAAFLLAVIANGSYSLFMEFNNYPLFWAVLVSWLGIITIIVIMAWSLKRQKNIIIRELKEEIPASSLSIIISKTKQRKALRITKKEIGKTGWENLNQQFQLLTTLAFKKYQSKTRQEEPILYEIETLRVEIDNLNHSTHFIESLKDSSIASK